MRSDTNNGLLATRRDAKSGARPTCRAGYVLLLVLQVVLAACGGGDETAAPEPGAVTVGPDGGKVSSASGTQVVVPPGAMAANATIRIANDSTDAPALPPSIEPAGEVVAITPHGSTFAKAITVRLPLPNLTLQDNQELMVAKAQPGGEWVLMRPTAQQGGLVDVDVRSFSFFQVVKVTYPKPLVPVTFEAFAFGSVTIACDGVPCGAEPNGAWQGSRRLFRPTKITVTAANNGGMLPANCSKPKFWMSTPFTPELGWFTPVDVVPGTATRVEFDLQVNLGYLLSHQSADAFAFLVCTDPATNIRSLQRMGGEYPFAPLQSGGFVVDKGTSVSSPALVLQFPAASTSAVGDTPSLRAVLQGGGAWLAQIVNFEQTGNADYIFTAPTTFDHATVHLERLGPAETTWRVVATQDQLNADAYPFGTLTPAWMYWSLDFVLPPLTLADNGALYQVRACFRGRDEPAAVAPVCTTGPAARVTVLQQLSAPAFTQQPR